MYDRIKRGHLPNQRTVFGGRAYPLPPIPKEAFGKIGDEPATFELAKISQMDPNFVESQGQARKRVNLYKRYQNMFAFSRKVTSPEGKVGYVVYVREK